MNFTLESSLNSLYPGSVSRKKRPYFNQNQFSIKCPFLISEGVGTEKRVDAYTFRAIVLPWTTEIKNESNTGSGLALSRFFLTFQKCKPLKDPIMIVLEQMGIPHDQVHQLNLTQ